MSEDKKKKESMGGNKKKSFLNRLPSNFPFPKVVRRPDYQLRDIRFKFKIPKRPINVSLLILMILMGTFFIYIGGFYFTSQKKLESFYIDPITKETSLLVKDDLQNQTILEGLAAGTLMSIGATGCYFIHLSSQYSYSPSTATKYLFIGILLVSFALICIMTIVQWKMEELYIQMKYPMPERDR